MAPKVIYDFDPRNLPSDLLAAIGLAMASAAQTEDVVNNTIAGLAGIDVERGKAITTHMSMPVRLSALSSLAAIVITTPDILALLDDCIERIRAALEKRNALAHDVWCRDPSTGQIYRLRESARVEYEAELVPATIDEVKAEALDVYYAGTALVQFLTVYKLFPPLPPSPRVRAHASKADRKKHRKRAGDVGSA